MANELSKPVSEPRDGKRFGCLLYSLCFLAVLALLIGISFFGWYANARAELDSQIERIRSRGEPLWFSELAPKAVDPELDATPLFLAALAKMLQPSQAFTDLIGADPPTPPGDYAVLATELQANETALALLKQALARPHFRLPLDYETKQPIMLLLGPVQDSRSFARLLQGQVLQSLGTGDQKRAVEATNELFELSELLRDEPITITQLVRFAIMAVGQGTLKQVVAHTDLSPEQFAELDERLAKMETNFTLVQAMHGERAMSFTTMNHLPENIAGMKQSDPTTAEAFALMGLGVFKPNFMADQAFMLRTMTDFVETMDKPGLEGRAGSEAFDQTIREASKRYIFSKLMMPALSHVRTAGIRYRQKVITARLGIRVDRYYAEHGSFPTSLDDVLDDRLQSVPVDLYVGKPLIYKLLPDGFTIYPVGDNGMDDGGGMKQDDQEFFGGFEVHYPQPAPKDAPTSPAQSDQK